MMPKSRASRVHLLSVLSLLTAIAVGACAGAAGRAETGAQFGSGFARVPASSEIQNLERQMAARVNRDRAKAGLSPLKYDDELSEIARAHSLDMRDHGFFGHESPNTGTLEDRVSRAGYLALESRENLAEAADVSTAEDNLLASPGHHANLMAKTVSHIGIGIVKGGVKAPGNLTITQVFAAPIEAESPTEATQKILAALTKARVGAGRSRLVRNPDLDALASLQIEKMPREPTPESLESVATAVTEHLSSHPIEGISGVAVGGQLLWHSSQFEPSSAVTRANVRHVGLAVRGVKDERGRPQLQVLVLLGL